tara:strand:+ start:209 stop:637 length:429 start_codon:yes stop_codon:yes gene_type:complete
MTDPIIKKAISFCNHNKHRLTVPRLNVLKIISTSKKPIKAYDILAKLGKVIKNPNPPTAYRAIEFWKKHNFVHRIESLNAYCVCGSDHLHSGGQFMICSDCGTVIETHLCNLPEVFKNTVKKNMFTLTNWNLEINGICKKCS